MVTFTNTVPDPGTVADATRYECEMLVLFLAVNSGILELRALTDQTC